MLLLKRHLIDLVRSGKKTQTIRLWRRPMVQKNQLAYTPGLGRMLILSVEKIESLAKLTREDAIADGFKSLAALKRELAAIYGKMHEENKSLYRVRFQWPPPSEKNAGRKKISPPAKPKLIRATKRTKKPAAKISPRQMRHALASLLRRRVG